MAEDSHSEAHGAHWPEPFARPPVRAALRWIDHGILQQPQRQRPASLLYLELGLALGT